MRHFRTVLLLSTAIGCGNATGGNTAATSSNEDPTARTVDAVKLERPALVLTDESDAGSDNVSPNQGGSAGSTSLGEGGSSGSSADAGVQSGGAGGSDVGSGGSNQAGAGGSAGSGDPDPVPPTCTFQGARCNGLLFETCTDGVYASTQCGVSPEVGMMCDEAGGCVGECANGDVRCSGNSVEVCGDQISGEWSVTESCAYQCVNGACTGACTPGEATCDGTSVVTCGQDFHYGNGVACSGAPHAGATCSGAGVCGTECVPGFADCSAAAGCETDLSSPDSCGACGNVCPGAPNATRTCNGGQCGLTPNACAPGTANCTGDFVCETNTTNDPNNCGGCGISCYGATCSNGQCTGGSLVAELTSANGNPQGLTVDGSYIYWIDVNAVGSPIHRTLKDGSGSVETVANAVSPDYPFRLVVGSGYVFFVRDSSGADSQSDGVYRVPVTGGTPEKLVSLGLLNKNQQPNKTLELTLSGDYLYWTDSNVGSDPGDLCYATYPSHQVPCTGGTVTVSGIPDHGNPPDVHIYRTAVSGGGTDFVTTLPSPAEYDSHIEVIGDQIIATQYVNIYYGPAYGYGYESRVRVFDLSTGAFVKSYSDSELTYLNSFEVSSSQVAFWSKPVAGDARCLTTIARSSDVTSGYTCVTQDADALLLVDSADVYYRKNGALLRRPVGGGSADVLAPSVQQVAVAAQDAAYVYWAVDVTGTGQKAILRAAK